MSESEKLYQGLQYIDYKQRKETIARYTNLLADMQPNRETLIEMRLNYYDEMDYYFSDLATANYKKITRQDTAFFMATLFFFCILPSYLLVIRHNGLDSTITILLLILSVIGLTFLVHLSMAAWSKQCRKLEIARRAATICAINNLLSR